MYLDKVKSLYSVEITAKRDRQAERRRASRDKREGVAPPQNNKPRSPQRVRPKDARRPDARDEAGGDDASLDSHEPQAAPPNAPPPRGEEQNQSGNQQNQNQQAGNQNQQAGDQSQRAGDQQAGDQQAGDQQDQGGNQNNQGGDQTDQSQPPQKKPGLPTGHTDETTALERILSFHSPSFFLLSAPGKPSELYQFFDKAKNDLKDGLNLEIIYGAPNFTGNERLPLEMTFGYIVSSRMLPKLEQIAKDLGLQENMHVETFNPNERLKKADPFDSLVLGRNIEGALGDTTELRAGMRQTFALFRKHGDGSTQLYEVSSLQMKSIIHGNYFRLLSKEHKTWKYFNGGVVDNAGRQGIKYVLCSKTEYDNFMKVMQEFKPPKRFGEEMYYTTALDQAFNDVQPETFNPENCVIITAKSTLDLKKKVEQPNGETVTLFEALIQLSQGVFLRDQKEGTGVDKEFKSDFHEGAFEIGNHAVNISRDYKRAILWIGRKPFGYAEEELESIQDVLGLSEIDTTYAH